MSFDPGAGGAPEGPFVAGGGGDAAALGGIESIDIASAMFREVAQELHHLRAGLRRGETEGLKDAARVVRDLRAATQLVLEERIRVDKLRKEVAGDVGGGSLDLAAARDEIGRRLACLRRAGGG
ncbi:MAG TPA: permease [Paracoccus sp. (in: a-proteobacteria)]|nr:permease [Paracoccus sp. (in: a-proteobacteria)]